MLVIRGLIFGGGLYSGRLIFRILKYFDCCVLTSRITGG